MVGVHSVAVAEQRQTPGDEGPCLATSGHGLSGIQRYEAVEQVRSGMARAAGLARGEVVPARGTSALASGGGRGGGALAVGWARARYLLGGRGVVPAAGLRDGG